MTEIIFIIGVIIGIAYIALPCLFIYLIYKLIRRIILNKKNKKNINNNKVL